MQLCKEGWKKKIQDINGVWTHELAIPVQCSTNWAMKPLTLGARQLWVHMFPWEEWVSMIYEIDHKLCELWKWNEEMIVEVNIIYAIAERNLKKIQDFNGVWTHDLTIPVRCSTNLLMLFVMLYQCSLLYWCSLCFSCQSCLIICCKAIELPWTKCKCYQM